MSAGGKDAALKARLIEIIKARSFQSGKEVKLASGRTSTYYFNMKPTMLDAEGAHVIATLILAAIADMRRRPHRRAGDGCRADRLGRRRRQPRRQAAGQRLLRAQAGQGARHQSLIEGLPNGDSLKGKRVVIVEDVTTTGGSAIKAAEAVRAEGAEVVGVVTVIDREEGAAEAFAAAGLKLTPILTLADFKS